MSDPLSQKPPPEVIEAFTSAAIVTLQELTGLQAIPDYGNADAQTNLSYPAVLAAIRLMRESPGSMTLALCTEGAAQLAARYLPPSTILTSELIEDVAGEFANVIAGQAKTMLKNTAFHFSMSTPVVTRAESPTGKTLPEDMILISLSAPDIGAIQLAVALPSGAEIRQ
jgi:CheY-specific phosphatase CheX